MASGFPGAIDNFSDPLANSPLNSPSHATLHSDVNDAVEKIETYMGLVLVTTQVATSGTSLSINNCFTSLYSSYRIVIKEWRIAASASGLFCRMRSSGTDATAGYYSIRTGWFYSSSAIDVSAQNNTTAWDLPIIADSTAGAGSIDIHNPQKAQKTSFAGNGSDSRTTGAGALTGSGMLNNTIAYDGFTVYSVQTITRLAVSVYGYRD